MVETKNPFQNTKRVSQINNFISFIIWDLKEKNDAYELGNKLFTKFLCINNNNSGSHNSFP